MREIPDEAVNAVPAGTPPARAARYAPFYCAHGVKFEYDAKKGYFFVAVNAVDDDVMHPKDLPYVGLGALPEACQPATGVDPEKYAQALARQAWARAEVLRERRERGLPT